MRDQSLALSSLLVATALAVAACSSGGGGGGNQGPPPNTAPTISGLSDVSINQDTATSALPVSITDQQTGAASLTVSVTAADEILLPADGITLSGSDSSRMLTLTPAESAVGSTVVTVTATDPQGLSTKQAFALTVKAVEASFTQFAAETFPMAADEVSRSFRGFTLNQDADDSETGFEMLLQ